MRLMEETGKIVIDEVEAVAKPPKARVQDVVEDAAPAEPRRRDYLDGFLAEKPQGQGPNEPCGEVYEAVIDRLKGIYDPEIPVDIYELGLIYDVKVSEEAHVHITMTLTSPSCPVAESLPLEVEEKVAGTKDINSAKVEIVFDPPWDKSMMSEEALLELGFM